MEIHMHAAKGTEREGDGVDDTQIGENTGIWHTDSINRDESQWKVATNEIGNDPEKGMPKDCRE